MKACIVVTTNLCYSSLFFLTLHVLVLCPDSLFLLNSSWQMCDTWCNIAYVHEKAGHEYDEIKDAYSRALEYAEQSGKLSSVVGFVEQYIKLWNIPHTPPLIQHFVLLRWLNTVLAVCDYMSFAKSWQEKGCCSQAETWQVKSVLIKDFDWQVKIDVSTVSTATWTIEYNLKLSLFLSLHKIRSLDFLINFHTAYYN